MTCHRRMAVGCRSVARLRSAAWCHRKLEARVTSAVREPADNHTRGDRPLTAADFAKLAVVEETKDDADAAARARIAQRCRLFIEEWEARKANPVDAVSLLRATLEPIGTLGTRKTQKGLQRLGEACLVASDDLDVFQARYARLVKAVALAL
jgi:hypothetical protein